MTFEDNRVAVKDALNNAGIAYLHAAAGELTSMTQRNVPDRGQWFNQQKNAWRYEVDETKMEAVVGNPQDTFVVNNTFNLFMYHSRLNHTIYSSK